MINKNELTPIEEYECAEGKIFLKRDDKFVLGEVNGGKLRQALFLIEKNLELIKERYKKKVGAVIIVFVGKDPAVALESLKTYNQKHILCPYHLSYSTKVKKYPLFDEIYEAKAFDWMIKNLDMKNKKVLFWVIGKRNQTFKPQKLKWENIEED